MHLLAVCNNMVNAMSGPYGCVVFSYHNIICYDYQVPYMTKTFIQFSLEYISSHCNAKGHYCQICILPISRIEGCEIRGGLIKYLMPIPFFAVTTVNMQASTSMWEMSSSVRKWYGSLVMALFRLVGSRDILNFNCPWMFLLSTRTKLLIHGVASVVGISTPACSILLISCWNASLRSIGIGLHGVCLGVTFGSM